MEINKIIFVLILIMQIGILYQLIEHDHDNRGIHNLIYAMDSKLDSEIGKSTTYIHNAITSETANLRKSIKELRTQKSDNWHDHEDLHNHYFD
tara:strand:- start:56 stop:334 length:279 start_codon:yes stop_codon:yes gene_type:complete